MIMLKRLILATITFCAVSVVGQAGSNDNGGEQKFANVIQGYIKEIEELK